MVRLRALPRPIVGPLALATLGVLSAPVVTPLNTYSLAGPAASACAPLAPAPAASVLAGRPYTAFAYQALANDRARFAGLGPQRRSAVLSLIAERHSAYMASIGTWSDGDPAGGILLRVRMAGLDATYAGQNVVTASGASVFDAIAHGEAFFAQEASGGGPHWDNITNPNHHFVGIGIALLGAPGAYTLYLTQVFSDVGGCGAALPDDSAPAAAISTPLRIGDTVHPSVDALQLRTEPRGLVIGTLHAHDRLKIVDLQHGWAQVKVLATGTYGWAFASFLVSV